MSDLITERTPLVIAAEINMIKHQTEKIVLYNAIKIGRRLTEAKSLVPHGEWGKRLEDSVSYSQRTAENLMRIFEEYGSNQLASSGGNAKSQTFAILSYSQAVIFLGIPENEREEFLAAHDIENMSVRKLQKAVKERDQALQDREQTFQDRSRSLHIWTSFRQRTSVIYSSRSSLRFTL
ncbi:MAG: DUF3102 domain-containing protein [Desulfitobacteriaceae bacterium]